MAVGISLCCPDLDSDELYALSESLSTTLDEAGVLVQRPKSASASGPGLEHKGDAISLSALLVSIASKASITAVVSSLKALFGGAPKSLTATVTNGEKSFSFSAG